MFGHPMGHHDERRTGQERTADRGKLTLRSFIVQGPYTGVIVDALEDPNLVLVVLIKRPAVHSTAIR